MAIGRDERRELRRLVEETFAYMREELSAREREARELIRERIMKENADNLQMVRDQFAGAIEIARQNNVEVRCTSGYDNYIRSATENLKFKPADLDERIDEEMRKLRDEADLGHISLKQEELRIKREITLDAISSLEAKAIIERIPDIDKLFPAPSKLVLGA